MSDFAKSEDYLILKDHLAVMEERGYKRRAVLILSKELDIIAVCAHSVGCPVCAAVLSGWAYVNLGLLHRPRPPKPVDNLELPFEMDQVPANGRETSQ